MPKRRRERKKKAHGGPSNAAEEVVEIQALNAAIEAGAPPVGSNPLSAAYEASDKYKNSFATATTFDELPLSAATKHGLSVAGWKEPTPVQQAAIPHALAGRDVLGAAKTGSGKTLAFAVPLVESLYRQRWSPADGLGAVVISPTRELAVQIFDVLHKVVRDHSLTLGLVIGGKDFSGEASRIHRINILVCTPGRLLQHLESTPGFTLANVQTLVLDEADRLLDMGFAPTLNAIVEALPPGGPAGSGRQTMLFSATQTRSVKDLARLSLTNPEYLAVHDDKGSVSTPEGLSQNYIMTGLGSKLDLLYGFIRTHLFHKSIVFLASCKQVRFVFEAFRHMRPGVPLLHLHGRMKQTRRMAIFYEFTRAQSAVLFATDIAARGLDFPAVDWVVQADAPEDVDTYIHRVGRTARYKSSGKALLLLLESEAALLDQLAARKIELSEIAVNPARTQSIAGSMSSLVASRPDLKYLGQKALISYFKSVRYSRNKAVFNVGDLPAGPFAMSMGLPGTPKIKLLSKEETAKKAKSRSGLQLTAKEAAAAAALAEGEDSEDEEALAASRTADARKEAEREAASAALRARRRGEAGEEDAMVGDGLKATHLKGTYDRLFSKKNQTVLSESYAAMRDESDDDGDESEEDGFLTVKRRDHDLGDADAGGEVLLASERLSKRALKRVDVNRENPSKVVFDEDGKAVQPFELIASKDEASGDVAEDIKERRERLASRMAEADVQDRKEEKAKRLEAKRAARAKKRAAMSQLGLGGGAGPGLAVLGSDDSESEDSGVDDSGSDSDDDSSEAEVDDSDEDEEDEEDERPRKRSRSSATSVDDVAADEDLALRLLAAKRGLAA